MHNNSLTIKPIDLWVFVLCILVTVASIMLNVHSFYHFLAILPITYGVCYLTLLAPIRIKTKSKTVVLFSIAEFIRLVFVPLYESISSYVGFYGFSTNDSTLINRAILLMAYECFFISVFLFVATRNNQVLSYGQKDNPTLLPLGKDRVGLLIIVMIGIAIFFAVPEVNKNLNFLFLSSNSDKVRALSTDSKSPLMTGLILISYYAILCIFLLVLDSAKKKYDFSPKKRYVALALLFGLGAVCVINGESRSTIVYTLFAVIACLQKSFEKYSKAIAQVVVVVGFFVLTGMTAYRLYSVYDYSSYGAALQGGTIRENYFSSFIEMYFLGPQSVACGLSFFDMSRSSFDIGTFLYDIFRPFMGLNFIAELFNGKTSILMYNSWFSGVEGKSNGLFLQISNQGYCYFGFFLAPLFACVFYKVSLLIERHLKKEKSLFLTFFFNYILIRTSTCVIGGTMSGFITQLTMTLLLSGALYWGQKVVGTTLFTRRSRLLKSY